MARSNCAEPNGGIPWSSAPPTTTSSYSQENIRYTVGLATTLPDGAEISIFEAVSGGAGPATWRAAL
jgi:hypothetical protein